MLLYIHIYIHISRNRIILLYIHCGVYSPFAPNGYITVYIHYIYYILDHIFSLNKDFRYGAGVGAPADISKFIR